MAKGRKFTTTRIERLLGTVTYAPIEGYTEHSELHEEDIWHSNPEYAAESDTEWEPRAAEDIRRMPRGVHVGGLPLVYDESASNARMVNRFGVEAAPPGGGHVARSAPAPVDVQDWSKVRRVDSEDELDESDSEVMPPHEYLARKWKSAVVSSVFEGAGRTLKGRDLSRVRDSVWRQTGFDG